MPGSSVHVHAGKKVHHMKPGLLAALLRDTRVVADRAVRLKELLPHSNVSAMAAKQPELLLQVMLASVPTLCGLLVDQMQAYGFDSRIQVWAAMCCNWCIDLCMAPSHLHVMTATQMDMARLGSCVNSFRPALLQ